MLERFCCLLQIPLGSPFPLAKEEELPAVLLAKRPLETQKLPLFSGWLLAHQFLSPKSLYSEILCKRMSWMVAQTMVRQLVSVVKTSI